MFSLCAVQNDRQWRARGEYDFFGVTAIKTTILLLGKQFLASIRYRRIYKWLLLIIFYLSLFRQGKQWPTSAHRYCGNGLPVDYLSSSRIVYVHFKSDDDVQDSGFKFTATEFSGTCAYECRVASNWLCEQIIFLASFSECARNYTALQGRLYGKSLSDCEQHINVPENYTITLYFTSLDFRTTHDCTETNAPLTVSRNMQIYWLWCYKISISNYRKIGLSVCILEWFRFQ